MRTPLFRALLNILAILLVSALVAGTFAMAEEEEEELPQKGTLSSNVAGGSGDGVAVDGVWGGNDMFGEGGGGAPITGSVSKINQREWMMRVINNSEDKYSVSVSVEQYNKSSKKIRGNNYAYTLAAGEQKERLIRVLPQTEQCSLKLKRWKNLSPKDEEKEKTDGTQASP